MTDDRRPFDDPSEERRFWEALITSSPTAIVTCDPELTVTSWNPAAESLFGYPASEAVGRFIDDLIAVGDDDEILAEATEVNVGVLEGPTELLTRRRRKDGEAVDVRIRAIPLMIDERLVGAFALYEDVGELVRQRRFFESLLEASPAAIAMVNSDYEVTLWNPGAERLFGYAADPGSILCGFRTYALIKDRVKAEEREPLTVKGASRPVEAWEVVELLS